MPRHSRKELDIALYAVEITLADDELRERLRPQHRAHLRDLEAEGVLWLAGPWVETAGTGLMVFEVPDRASLDRVLAADPYAVAGLVIARRINLWQPVLGSRLAASAGQAGPR